MGVALEDHDGCNRATGRGMNETARQTGWAGPGVGNESGAGTRAGRTRPTEVNVSLPEPCYRWRPTLVHTQGWVRLCLLALVLLATPAQAAGPDWKIGRAVIGQGGVLKLSLRNQGQEGATTVTLAGRWTQGARSPADALASLPRLGSFTRQVAGKHTAILQVGLGVLGPRPEGASLELVLWTGQRVTDQRIVP